MSTTKIDYVNLAEIRIDELEAENEVLRNEVFDSKMTKAVIRQNARLFVQIQELEAENQRLRDANRWIPVEERLPTSDGNKDVILVNAEGYRWQTVVWFENARFVLQSGEEVEFWSERRPEPYQGDV